MCSVSESKADFSNYEHCKLKLRSKKEAVFFLPSYIIDSAINLAADFVEGILDTLGSCSFSIAVLPLKG